MEQQHFGNALPFTPQQLRGLLAAPDGRRLLAILSRDGGAALREAAAAFRAGDLTAVENAVAPLLQTPEAQALLAELTGRAAQGG